MYGKKESKLKEIWDRNKKTIVLVGTILMVWAFLYIFVIVPTTVSGPSMLPNLQDGEKCLSFKMATPNRGDVIAFNAQNVDPQAKHQRTLYVKRVIGVPGDTVKFDGKDIYVNDKKINDNIISTYQQTTGTSKGAPDGQKNWDLASLAKANDWQLSKHSSKVPNNTFFVLGDHRSISQDSRYFGFVPQNDVIGVVKAPMWYFGKRRWYINNYHKSFFKDSKENQMN